MGSSRYKSALHSRIFDKAIKKYRKNMKQTQDVKRPRLNSKNTTGAPTGARKDSLRRQQSRPTVVRLREAEEQVQRALEVLPTEIIRNARTFHDYMEFFVSGGADGIDPVEEGDDDHGKSKIPPDMTKLLDELGEIEGINQRLKAEILQDEDARKVR